MPDLPRPTDAAIADDPMSFQAPPVVIVRMAGTRHFAILGLVAFALAMVATLPARVVLPAATVQKALIPAVGTIWNGEAAIGDETAVSWRFAPLRSVLSLGVATDVVIRGGATDLTAQAVWRPGRLELQDLTGVAGPGLVNTLIDDLPIRCDLSFVVDLDRVVIAGPRSRVTGSVRSGPGICTAENGMDTNPAAIPAMVGSAVTDTNGSTAWLAPAATPRGERLVQMTINRSGKLTATVLSAGVLILPAAAGQMSIETQL